MTRLVLGAALALVAASAAAAGPELPGALQGCAAPAALMEIAPAEPRIALRIGRREPLTIVAVGSSSTQGAGASTPDLSYPSRLAAELKSRFPALDIRVINRGKGGEDVAEE